MAKIAEKVPSWVARVLLPEIRSIIREEISSEVKRLEDRIGSIDEKIDLVRNELLAEIRRVDEKLITKIESIERSIPLASRLAVLEAEVKELKEKIGKT
ncbi:hypothetical protein HRbin02_00174 [Candidatus Calditenuaceae archaeon HR02]|nr:hypothetical protein HRbin02_00174 [Candidatus Calditenuaceae archaeon HR02]